jgi:(2R)-sulfolactate sulfo-lyase subunit alpha
LRQSRLICAASPRWDSDSRFCGNDGVLVFYFLSAQFRLQIARRLFYNPQMAANKQSAAPPDFLVHNAADNVGVVVAEDAAAGKVLCGWVMANDETIEIRADAAIPLGHKIALADIAEGEAAIKYGADIGRAVAAIGRGAHVHTHNLKTKRW